MAEWRRRCEQHSDFMRPETHFRPFARLFGFRKKKVSLLLLSHLSCLTHLHIDMFQSIYIIKMTTTIGHQSQLGSVVSISRTMATRCSAQALTAFLHSIEKKKTEHGARGRSNNVRRSTPRTKSLRKPRQRKTNGVQVLQRKIKTTANTLRWILIGSRHHRICVH